MIMLSLSLSLLLFCVSVVSTLSDCNLVLYPSTMEVFEGPSHKQSLSGSVAMVTCVGLTKSAGTESEQVNSRALLRIRLPIKKKSFDKSADKIRVNSMVLKTLA